MKIDLTAISGYESMTTEQKLAALEAFEFDTSELDTLREQAKTQKGLIDKYTGEIKTLKNERNNGLSEAERKAKEQENAMAELQEKYDALLKSSTISSYKAKYLGLGYEEALAADTADALANNDMDRFFANVGKHLEALSKKQTEEAARNTPKLDGKGAPSKVMTREDILKMKDPVARQQAIAEHTELFSDVKGV